MAVGVAALCFALNDLWSWTQMSRWQSVPAELESLDLTTGSTDNSTTYRVRATYRYSFAGRSYTADRVAIDRMADNIGSFQHDLYASLRAAQAVGRVTAFVDPAQPSSATLNRDLRPLMLVFEAAFALVFGGVGVALVLGGKLGARRLAEKRELESRYPDQPWRWRADWAAGEIRSSSRATAYGAAGFAAIWNVVAIPTGIFVWPEIERGHYAALVGLLFPIAGAGLAFWAARQWLRARRVKGATLHLQRVPIALGSRLRGTIRVDATTEDAREFSIEVSCVEKHRARGRNGESSERIAWQNRWTVPREQCEMAPTYGSIPLDLAIPLELPAATARDEPDEVVWLLDVNAKCRGPDLWMRFELPVFTGERALDLAPPVEDADARPDAQALAELGIVYERVPDGGESWTFRRAQHTSAAVTATAVAVAFCGAAMALWIGDAPRIFAVAFGAFGALFAWAATGLWFTEYRVTLGGGLLTLARRGITGARAPVQVPQAWIRAIRARRGMQAGRRLYYDLFVETAEDSLTAARSIADYSVAAWLARYWQGQARRELESGRQVAAALAPTPQVSAQPR